MTEKAIAKSVCADIKAQRKICVSAAPNFCAGAAQKFAPAPKNPKSVIKINSHKGKLILGNKNGIGVQTTPKKSFLNMENPLEPE